MNLCLKPVDELGMDDIRIDGNLFFVGRQEEPFASCSHSGVARLSRKHARIFEENNGAYVVDLGSLNGTRLNGQAVTDQPAQIHDGDKLDFAGLTFITELEGMTDDRAAQGEAIRVVLTPESETNGQPLMITEFPFLVSKSEGVFFEYKERFNTVHQYISRRHAYLFIKKGQLYLEDLNSTNGTYKGDIRLEEEPLPLANGDMIAFGDCSLKFKVAILKPETTGTGQTLPDQTLPDEHTSIIESDDRAQSTEDVNSSTSQAIPLAAADNEEPVSDFEIEPGTILVDKASPFLDIFCPEDESDRSDSNAETPEQKASDGKSATPSQPSKTTQHGQPSVWCRLSIFFSELRMALGGKGEGTNSRSIKGLSTFLIIVLVAAGLIAVLLFRESSERDIKRLIAEGRYTEAAAAANLYLTDHPNDRFVEPLAFEALLKMTVPQWQWLIKNKQFTDARQLIDDTVSINSASNSATQALRLLNLVGEFDQFMQESGSETLTHLYRSEDKIDSLVRAWGEDERGHRQIMDRISGTVAGFEVNHARLYSQLRMLRAEQDLYNPALEAFKQQIDHDLTAGDDQNLQLTINRFTEKYPSIGGLSTLHADLTSYLLIKAAVEEGDAIALKQLAANLRFQTPPFQQKVQMLLADLPSDEFVAQIRQAESLWSVGELDRAIATLEALQAGSQSPLVSALITRYQNLKEQWEALAVSAGNTYPQDKLIALYQRLDKEKDGYLWSSLANEFAELEASMLSQSNQFYDEAKTAWTTYLNNGGIWGALRLESTVSSRYREQAKLLSEANSQVLQGARIYELLGADKSQALSTFEAQVKGEAQRQRKWIQDLHLVLDAVTLDEKIGLLPTEEER